MAKRKLDDTRLREVLRARLTKGDAFRCDHDSYWRRQRETTDRLAGMTRAELFEAYRDYLYDVIP